MGHARHQTNHAESANHLMMAKVRPPNHQNIAYDLNVMPQGMVGMILYGHEFGIRWPKKLRATANGTPGSRSTIGVPSTQGQQTAISGHTSTTARSRRSQGHSERSGAYMPSSGSRQTALPGHTSTTARSRHNQGHSERSGAYMPSSGRRQTALPSYDTAMALGARGEGGSGKSRVTASFSRQRGHPSISGAADVMRYEQEDDECKVFGAGNECGQWEPSAGLQTVSKVQTEMPLATKQQMKESGICVKGFDWVRQIYNGWRCAGGHHFVFDNRAAADKFIREWIPKMLDDFFKHGGEKMVNGSVKRHGRRM
ncbi:MAG: hypothetical protein Q9198_001822 [Flavoplaca austrocitrina]